MRPPRLLILSVGAGAGHVRAAAALCEQASSAGVEVSHIDVMQRVPRWFRWLYADLYATLVQRAPLLWRWLYGRMNHTSRHGGGQRLRRLLERRLSARWLAELAAMAPDAIVCTHFLPAEVLGYRPGQRSPCPLFVHITDFDLHAMWVQPGVDAYFAGSEEVAFQLRHAGVDAARIEVSGIALLRQFTPPQQPPAARAGQRPTVLLMGGGGGFGGLVRVAESLLAAAGGFHLKVLCGRNGAALAALQALAPRWPGRLSALGFTDQVAAVMAGADIVITKPGGLTSAECLALGMTIIVNAPIPGQEERNADYLLEHGAALKAVDAATLAWRLQRLLDDAPLRAAMAARARSLGRPEAARHIIDAVLRQLKAQPCP